MSRTRRGVVLVAALTLAIGGLIVPPAAAATVVETIDGITYTADDADVAAGATVTAFDQSTTTVTIPDTVDISGTDYDVVAIGAEVFRDAALTSVLIGDNVMDIGLNAFQDNELTTLTLPNSVTNVSTSAFLRNQLTSLTLSNSLIRIRSYAFNGNQLTSVSVPASVTHVYSGAFGENPGLQSVNFAGEAPDVSDASQTQPTFDTSSGSLVLTYPWRYGDPQTSGGYTSPTWNGYDTQAIATVNFDLNGYGAPAPADQDVAVGETADAPTSDPTESGFDFTGWYTDAAATSEFDFTDPITADTTLYAGWEEAASPGDGVTVTKTVDASFVRVYAWDLAKSGEVGEISVGDDTASAEVDYTVTATPDGSRDAYYVFSGEITVTNETGDDEEFTVTDTPDAGNYEECRVTAPGGGLAEEVVIAAGDTATFGYRCSRADAPADGTNTATVTWGDGEEASVTEDVVFTQRDTTFESVTVVDDQTTPDQGWETLGEADWNADGTPVKFTYTLTHEELEVGECTSFTNVARINETEQTVDETVEICPEADPAPSPELPKTGADVGTGADVNGGAIAALLFLVTGGSALTLRRRQLN